MKKRIYVKALAKIVIPAKAGIHMFSNALERLDSRLRGNDRSFIYRTFARGSIVIGLLVYVTGCSLTPKYKQPSAPVATEWPVKPYKESLPQTDAPAARELKWQDFFNNPRLQKIIEIALNNNRDLRLTSLNIERASAMYGIKKNEHLPSVSGVASVTKQQSSTDLLPPGESRVTDRYSINLGVIAWELDFFGRIASLKEIALQEYLATEQAKRSAKSLLIAAIANTYLSLGANREAIKLAEDRLKNLQDSSSLIKRLVEIGLTTELDLRKSEMQVDLARTVVSRYTQLALMDENALNLLLGASVQAELLPEDLSTVNPTKQFSTGIPSEVLLHRPDILHAENRLKAANTNIGAARAALFPRISLTGTIGTASDELTGLFGSGTDTWSFIPQINIPIFDARTRFAVEVSKVDRELALTEYEKTIQKAFKEVADALAVNSTTLQQVIAHESVLNNTLETYSLVNARYTNGIDSYLKVLEAKRSIYDAELGLLTIQLTKMVNQVTLYKALGGGEN